MRVESEYESENSHTHTHTQLFSLLSHLIERVYRSYLQIESLGRVIQCLSSCTRVLWPPRLMAISLCSGDSICSCVRSVVCLLLDRALIDTATDTDPDPRPADSRARSRPPLQNH